MELVSLCNVPRIQTPDGLAGVNANFLYPFYGYWYPDGRQIQFAQNLLPQQVGRTSTGTHKLLPFKKAAGVCITNQVEI